MSDDTADSAHHKYLIRKPDASPCGAADLAAPRSRSGSFAMNVRKRVTLAAAMLAVVATPDALAVMAAVGGGRGLLDGLGGGELGMLVPDPAGTGTRLIDAGLLVLTAEPTPALIFTQTGREAWMAVRSLIQ